MVPPQVKTVADFIEWCRANPTKSAYGTPGAGTPMHFLGAMLATAGDMKYLHVPYQGSGPATQDVLGGQIASAIVPVPAVVQLREPERLRVLATTGPQRSSSLPDVSTMKEAGFPALEFSEGSEYYSQEKLLRTLQSHSTERFAMLWTPMNSKVDC